MLDPGNLEAACLLDDSGVQSNFTSLYLSARWRHMSFGISTFIWPGKVPTWERHWILNPQLTTECHEDDIVMTATSPAGQTFQRPVVHAAGHRQTCEGPENGDANDRSRSGKSTVNQVDGLVAMLMAISMTRSTMMERSLIGSDI